MFVASKQFSKVQAMLTQCQLDLLAMLEGHDMGQKFIHDDWQYQGDGGGKSCVLADGQVFERAGVNFSAISGASLPKSATDNRSELAGRGFRATGVSVVVHPQSPMVPTCHANFRFIEVEQDDEPVWWFGGGFDLTPYYGFAQDCVAWHRAAKQACDPYDSDRYNRYKKWCDDYFYLPHRSEPRGIGGLFFDDLNEGSFDQCLAFLKDVTHAFQCAYHDIILRRKSLSFTQEQKDFQLYRRGRYVEFNLLYDRGTLFGIQSKGRTESILMSMPPAVHWRYDWHPKPNTKEAKLYSYFLQPRDWLNQSEVIDTS